MNAAEESTANSPWGGLAAYVAPGLVVLFLVLMGATYYWGGVLTARDERYLGLLAQESLLSRELARYAVQAANGDVGALDRLEALRDRSGTILRTLREGDPQTGLPALPRLMAPQRAKLEQAWHQAREALSLVREEGGGLVDAVRAFEAFSTDTLLKSDELVNVMVETGASPEQVYAATRQLMLLERLAHNLRRTLAGGREAEQAGERFERDLVHFRQVTQALLGGDEKLGIEPISDSEARALLEDILAAVEGRPGTPGALLGLQEAAAALALASDALAGATSVLVAAYRKGAGRRVVSPRLGHVFGALALVSMMLTAVQLVRGARRWARPTREPGEAQEADGVEDDAAHGRDRSAVLNLLEEVQPVAVGDLSVTVTVTGDITRGLAEAINGAVERMRLLVVRARESAAQVGSAARVARGTTRELLETAGYQEQQLETAAAIGDGLVEAMARIAASAAECQTQAERALGLAVRQQATIRGVAGALDATRDALREATQRLKRVGEGCQEAGNLVGFIDDIADQANILALNAAIQTSVGGHAEKGSAPVADEVQRVAERFAHATRQIEPMVEGIQSAAREAMSSVELVTGAVVDGARAVKGRGAGELDKPLERLDSIAREVSGALQEGILRARGLGEDLGTLRAAAGRMTAAIRDTGTRTADLGAVAEALRTSAAGFRLSAPGRGVGRRESSQVPQAPEALPSKRPRPPAGDAPVATQAGAETG